MKTADMMAEEIGNLEKEIERRKNMFALLPDELPDYVKIEMGWSYFELDIPYDLEKLKEVSSALQSAGWFEEHRHFDKNSGVLKVYMNHFTENLLDKWERKLIITIELVTYKKGSTCKLVKLGTETREYSIYETQCLESNESTTN